MYEASIPQFVRMLGNLSAILDKAKTHAETKNIDGSVLINARLAPDMYPLSQQIQIATYIICFNTNHFWNFPYFLSTLLAQ